jgi:hypothetical protein
MSRPRHRDAPADARPRLKHSAARTNAPVARMEAAAEFHPEKVVRHPHIPVVKPT